MMPAKPRVFISHHHHDNGYCQEFADALRDQGLDEWHDEAINKGEIFDRRNPPQAVVP
jgi:hypothetical protein